MLVALVNDIAIAVVAWIYITGPASAFGMLGYMSWF